MMFLVFAVLMLTFFCGYFAKIKVDAEHRDKARKLSEVL